VTSLKPCGLVRRLLGIGYDALLLLALFFIATAIVLPFTDGMAIESGNPFFTFYLLIISYLYFAWQWTHGGQTLGMRAWRIRLADAGGKPVSWSIASKRYLFACLSWLPAAAGYFWALFDREGLALHDRLSGSRLYHDPTVPATPSTSAG